MPSAFDTLSPWRRGLRWRLVVLGGVLISGLIAQWSGAQFSDRPMARTDVLGQLYYTLGLFVFGGLDLGVPTGGPTWARCLLWLTYFGAPAVTTSALVESLLSMMRPAAWRLRRMSEHAVVGGCGRLAMLYMDLLRQRDRNRLMLVVEKDPDNPRLRALREQSRTEVQVGDIATDAVLAGLRLGRAHQVLLLTGDDYANLDAASRICHLQPELANRLTVHVSNIRLLRMIEAQNILPGVTKFNSYRTAARHLVRETMMPHFRLTERLDTVVLAGFGRFGQTVLDELQTEAAALFQTVVLIDLSAHRKSMIFAEQIGFCTDHRHEALEGDLRDPAVWEEVRTRIGETETKPVFVLGSGDDGINIQTALWLSTREPRSKIVARCFDQSAFTRDISRAGGFEIVGTAELLMASLA